MYFVTRELKKNKDLREVILNNIKFKQYSFSNKEKHYENNKANPMVLGSAYEIVLQIEKLRKEKNPYEIRNLKFNRGINVIMGIDPSLVNKDVKKKLKRWINKYNENLRILVKYIEGKNIKEKKLAEAILFLNFISLFREYKNVFYFEEKYTKQDIKEVAEFLKDFKKKFMKKIFKKEDFIRFNYLVSKGYLSGEIDILTDTYIYDIKTTAYPDFTKDMILQLVLYYVLLKRQGIKIEKGGIIFSKFKHIEYIDYNKLFKKKGLKKIEDFLENKYRI